MTRILCAVMVLLFANSFVVADDQPKKIELDLDGYKLRVEVERKTGKLPFYFPEGVVIENKNPAKQYREYLRYINATQKRFQRAHTTLIAGDSITIKSDLDSTSKPGKPAKMTLFLDHYVVLPDGRIRVTDFLGQTIITKKELQIVIDDMMAVIDDAATADMAYYKDLYQRIVASRAKHLGLSKEEFVKHLNEKVDGTDVTYRELNSIPLPLQKSDFVPREVHLGYTPEYGGVLGLTWLNSGVVYYNPQARVLDYLVGRPMVMMHEMIHANHKLQNYPLANYFDVEMLAMIPEGLLEETQIYLFGHHYFEELRTLCWIYFGFDFEEARKRFVKFNSAGNIFINDKEYNQYCDLVKKMQRELQGFFQEVIVPEYYASPTYWMGFNDKMQNNNAYIWVMFRKHYEPTILGGHKKTRIQLEADKVKRLEIAKKAWKRTGNSSSSGFGMFTPPSFMVKKYETLFTKKERSRIERYFRDNPRALESLKQMSVKEIIELAEGLSKKEGVR